MERISSTEEMTETMECIVSEEQTAAYVGSGRHHVLATPTLVALMERLARTMVERMTSADWSSVGNYVSLRHEGMVALGEKVRIEVTLLDKNDREWSFGMRAYSHSEKIAEGIHKRIVSRARVLDRFLRRKS